MTNYANAETLRQHYLTQAADKNKVNICTARPNWNGCDYCDVYAGAGLECWKQDGKHNCIRCARQGAKTSEEVQNMIKYHDNMRGPMYGPDHMLTDNWSPAAAVPGTFIRVYFRIDCPAFDDMHGQFHDEAGRAAFYVDARAVLARFNVAEGIRMDNEPAQEHLHLHPQNISGTVETCKVQPIAEALSACGSFSCRWVDLYEEISAMSNEEFIARLDEQKQEIKADLLAAFTTKRSNLYIVPSSFSGPCFTLAKKYSIPRWTCEHGQDSHAVRYMQHLLDACVQSGEIVTAQTRHGTGYRTAKKQSRKES